MIDPNTFNKEKDFTGTKGIVFIGDKIVVTRRDGNTNRHPFKIDLLGGGREGVESPFETFKREVKEEANLIIKKEFVVFSKPHPSFTEIGKEGYFMVVKSDTLKEEDMVLGNEGTEILLISVQDFLERQDGIQGQKDRVIEYLNLVKVRPSQNL